MKTFSIRYKSTNCYFIDTGDGLLAFDVGWPDTFREYRDGLKGAGRRAEEIRWFMVSHFHMDHAGLAGVLADRGAVFWVFENQLGAVDEMEELLARKNIPYGPIDRAAITPVLIAESRALLKSIGVEGEVVKTSGHGEHCVTLLLDSGEAFIGDLPPEHMTEGYDPLVEDNWRTLRGKGARKIFPAHAGAYEIDPPNDSRLGVAQPLSSPPAVSIRRCGPEDLENLINIGRETYDETFRSMNTPETMDQYLTEAFAAEKIRAELLNENSEFHFLYSGGELAGYIKMNLAPAQSDINDPESLELERIYVRKGFKGRGLGKAQLDFAVARAGEYGKKYIWLGVWERNAAAIAFYEGNGFRKTGEHSFRMGDEMQSDFVMTRYL